MKLENVGKIYNINKENSLEVLSGVNITFTKGKMYAIMGRSGSGKTTLINILGLLDNPTSGNYYFDGKDTNKLSSGEKAYIRNQKIGFIFQSYFLDPRLNVMENVMLPAIINKNITKDVLLDRVRNLLLKFDILEKEKYYPAKLSGGEAQRVAIARSLINNPDIIIADEPTGSVDEDNEKLIIDYLKDIAKEGKCVIVVSHNPIIKKYADEVYELKNKNLEKI